MAKRYTKGSSKKSYKVSLTTNYGRIDNLKLEKIKRIKEVAIRTVGVYLRAFVNEARKNIEERVGNVSRRISDSSTSLAQAYREASTDSISGDPKSGIITARFLDSEILDRMLPRSENSVNKEAGGWWRMHEIGSPSLVGASTQYGFMSKEHLEMIKGDRFYEGAGRHNEGVMVHKDSQLANIEGFTTFKGVKPFRILSVARSNFASNLQGIKQQVERAMFESLK